MGTDTLKTNLRPLRSRDIEQNQRVIPEAIKVAKTALRMLGSREAFAVGALARNKAGSEVHPCDPRAAAWSLDGALEAVRGSLPAKSEVEEALRRIAGKPLPRFSDEAGFAGVREALGCVVETLQKRLPKEAA